MGATQNNISLKELEVFFRNGGLNTQSLVYSYDKLFNDQLWKKYFVKAATPTPLDAEGKGHWSMTSFVETASVMPKPRASWSEMDELDKGGFTTYTGSNGQYGLKHKWTPEQLADFQRAVVAAGSNDVIERAYMKKPLELLKGAHALTTNLSMQLMSKGQFITVNDRGWKNQGKAEIPTAYFKTCGDKIWSDTSADIILAMQTIEKSLRDATGYEGGLSWKMDRTRAGHVLANTKVQNYLKGYLAGRMNLLTTDAVPYTLGTVAAYNAWVAEIALPNLSPIEVIEEQQVSKDGIVKTNVHGWESKNAVLSPMGLQGEIKYSAIEELNWIDTEMAQVAYTEGGLFALANYKVKNPPYADYHTNLYMHLAPALSVFDKMMIVDTTDAD